MSEFKEFWVDGYGIFLSGDKTLEEMKSYGFLNPIKVVQHAALEVANKRIAELEALLENQKINRFINDIAKFENDAAEFIIQSLESKVAELDAEIARLNVHIDATYVHLNAVQDKNKELEAQQGPRFKIANECLRSENKSIYKMLESLESKLKIAVEALEEIKEPKPDNWTNFSQINQAWAHVEHKISLSEGALAQIKDAK